MRVSLSRDFDSKQHRNAVSNQKYDNGIDLIEDANLVEITVKHTQEEQGDEHPECVP